MAQDPFVALGPGTVNRPVDRDYQKLRVDASGNLLVAPGPGSSATVSPVNEFAEVLAVASGSETLILTYTVPVAMTLSLERIDVSGTNIGTYNVYADVPQIARKRTWFNGDFSEVIDFSSPERSQEYLAGTVITVKVLHNRPDPGDFEARLQGLLR